MHILLYVPDNRVTSNFIPQLWPFVLQRRTPVEHQVTIIDGNATHWSTQELVAFILKEEVALVGIGFMTRMAQKAYQVAAAIRQGTRALIVMGGPHVTAVPGEPLGLTGQPPCADAVVQGEADDLWPQVVADVASGQLKKQYALACVDGKDIKPSLQPYPIVAWDQMDLGRFDLMRFVPATAKSLLKHAGVDFDFAYVIPVESGRGCPCGCEFCTVTGFFCDQVRFRNNESVIEELLRLKAMARKQKALLMVFFIDDNFAINPKRAKALLREMIRQDACLPWIGQISINLAADEELVELMEVSGCRYIFVGLESVDSSNLKVAHKQFNQPAKYEAVLNCLARHNLYAITSFIFGMDADQTGVSKTTVNAIDTWPPGLPVFGLLTPYPATPLYKRISDEGRLTRPQHWLDFQAFRAAFAPKNISVADAEKEIALAWQHCYGPGSFYRAQQWLLKNYKPFGYQLMHFLSRLIFRGIYFPQMSRWAWLKLLLSNVRTLISLVFSGFRTYRQIKRKRRRSVLNIPQFCRTIDLHIKEPGKSKVLTDS